MRINRPGTAVLLLLLFGAGCATTPVAGVDTGPDTAPGGETGLPLSSTSPGAHSGSELTEDRAAFLLMTGLKTDLEAGNKVEPSQAQRLVQIMPDDSYSRFLAGQIYLRNGDAEKARTEFLRSSELDRANVHALSALGSMALNTGDLAAADLYYSKAYNASADPATANRLALVRIRGGHPESARAILTRTLADDPGDIMTRNNLAVAMDMMGMASEGLEILGSDEVRDPRLLSTRALLQLKEGHPVSAVSDLETLTSSGSSGVLWLLMGTADLQQGKLAEAENKFRSAIALEPSRHEGYLNLGLTLRRQGRFTEAEGAYLEGQARASHPDIHLNLGVLYELYRGKPDLALEQYRKYLQMGGPASDRVRGWVEYLEGVVEGP